MSDSPDIPSWLTALLSGGGLAMFSGVVWNELRQMRAAVNELVKTMTALLERDRMRSGPTRLPTLPGSPE